MPPPGIEKDEPVAELAAGINPPEEGEAICAIGPLAAAVPPESQSD